MIYEELMNRLVAADPTTFIAGNTVYVHRMPDTVKAGVLIMHNPSRPLTIDHELGGIRRGQVMIVARGKSQLEGQGLILKAVDALTIMGETQVGDYLIKQLLPLTDPIIYPISDGQFIEQAVNFRLVFSGV